MRILVVSDVEESILYDHFQREQWPPIDLVLSCGDLQASYLSFLSSAFNVPVYYVCGNHDESYAQEPPEGGEDLDGRLVDFRGWRIAGLEGSHWYNGKECQYQEWQMRLKTWRLTPLVWLHGGLDIVVTHAPPRGCHDAEDLCHQGFESFNGLIRRHRPSYLLHGHSHLSYQRGQRITRLGQTTVINSYGHYLLELPDRA
ncbi:MAG: metallophosphoesterase [Chloroflexota bacterium]|jgi:Icc-related predicted phosphoesterase